MRINIVAQAGSPMSPSFLESGRQSRAALLSRAGRPRPAYSVCTTIEQADEDVGRGPGGPPHKTMWHWVGSLLCR